MFTYWWPLTNYQGKHPEGENNPVYSNNAKKKHEKSQNQKKFNIGHTDSLKVTWDIIFFM